MCARPGDGEPTPPRAALEREGGGREVLRPAGAAVTGGWRAGAVAALAVAKWLEGDGGGGQ